MYKCYLTWSSILFGIANLIIRYRPLLILRILSCFNDYECCFFSNVLLISCTSNLPRFVAQFPIYFWVLQTVGFVSFRLVSSLVVGCRIRRLLIERCLSDSFVTVSLIRLRSHVHRKLHSVLYCFVGLLISMVTLQTLGKVVSKIVNKFVYMVETKVLGRRKPDGSDLMCCWNDTSVPGGVDFHRRCLRLVCHTLYHWVRWLRSQLELTIAM